MDTLHAIYRDMGKGNIVAHVKHRFPCLFEQPLLC